MGMTDTQAKRSIAILFGGRSGEHEVSLMSARSVLSVLNLEQYEITEIGITHSGAWLTGKNALSAFEQGKFEDLNSVSLLPDPSKPGLYVIHKDEKDSRGNTSIIAVDVFFPVIHGTFGEDGAIQGLFEMSDVAYVGAGIIGSSVGMEKGVFKAVMVANNIPVLDAIVVLRSEIENNLNDVIKRVEGIGTYPLFIKPANLGSSVGITKCRSRADIAEGLMEAALYDRRIIIERGIPNPREIEISVLGNDNPQTSVPGEIIPGADFYSYDAKYILDTSELCIPAILSENQTAQIKTLAIKVYKAIDCCGMARVDFLLDPKTDEIFVNEINTIPGFTKISMYPKLWEASGLPYAALVERLIELAMERKSDRNRTIHQFRRDL
jgi:D-alanine-D-alanine ligase